MNKLLILAILSFTTFTSYAYDINELEYPQLSYLEKEQLDQLKFNDGDIFKYQGPNKMTDKNWDNLLEEAELTWKMATEYHYDFGDNNIGHRKGALLKYQP